MIKYHTVNTIIRGATLVSTTTIFLCILLRVNGRCRFGYCRQRVISLERIITVQFLVGGVDCGVIDGLGIRIVNVSGFGMNIRLGKRL